MATKKKKNKKITIRNHKKLLIKASFWTVVSIISFVLLLITLVHLGVFGRLPKLKELQKVKHYEASEIFSSDDKLLGRYYIENRSNTEIGEIPKHFIEALIATEDVRFYHHQGVDFRSTARVFVKSILLFNKSAGGGSTITQQLAKNLYPRKKYWILTLPVAKIREIIIAKRLEKVYKKEDILELYLNTVSFGENTYGVETASLVYFNKIPKYLKIEESALLVGLLKANTNYNPIKHYEAAVDRRNTVLNQMAKYEFLSQSEVDSLKGLPIQLKYRKLTHTEGPAPYFREFIRHKAEDIVASIKKADGSAYNIYTDGLKIYTSLNASFQVYAELAVKEHMKRLQETFDKHWKGRELWKKNPKIAINQIRESKAYNCYKDAGFSEIEILEKMKNDHKTTIFTWDGEKIVNMSSLDSVLHHFAMMQTGVVVLNARSGDILAWVGGNNYKYFKYDHVTAHRQAGSIFKPIVYAGAYESGIRPCDFYANDSVVYEDYDNWTPKNADWEFGGSYSVKGALANSVNTVSVKLLFEQGIQEVADLASRMGIKSDIPHVPSIALGTSEVSLLEMVKTYAVFLNKGRTIEPNYIRKIEDQDGKVIYKSKTITGSEQVLSDQTIQMMLLSLKHVVDSGTARGLRSMYRFTNDLAGKTGTTQDQTDGWFIGLTPDLVIGVWVGGDNPVVRFRSTTFGQGSYSAMPIFARFLKKVYNDPVYRGLQSSTFEISPAIYDEFDCGDYKEEDEDKGFRLFDGKGESIEEFIKRIFQRKKDKKDRKRKREKENSG